MNVYNINDKEFLNSKIYQDFIKENNGYGFLIIRASSAKGAIPIKGLKIEVSTDIDDNKVVFFDGQTDNSGMIESLALPAPKKTGNDMIEPKYKVYTINASYNNDSLEYKVNLYDNISVVQNINIVPKMKERKSIYGY